MNENITPEDRGRSISTLIRNQAWKVVNEYETLHFNAPNKLFNALAFALNDEEPIVSSGRIIDPENNLVELVVFTKSKVIYLRDKATEKTPQVRVIPRNTLTELTVLETPQVVPAVNREWSRGAKYSLKYGNGVEFDLPMEYAVEEAQTAIDQLYPDLCADIES
ncbi:hypothetical protein [Glutamicibacter mysorens]|nr:hypothetical protein [Glutamicibacter mysorens]